MGTRSGSECRQMKVGFMVRMEEDPASRVRSAASAAGISIAEWFRCLAMNEIAGPAPDDQPRESSGRLARGLTRDQRLRLVAALDLLADFYNAEPCRHCHNSSDPDACGRIKDAARAAYDALVAAIQAGRPS